MDVAPPLSPADAAALRRWGAQLSPSSVYLRIDDNLRVTAYNALASVVLQVRSRVLSLDGQVQGSADAFTPSTARAASASVIITDEGWLLGGEVFVSGAAPLVGQTFVVVEIVRGSSGTVTPLQVIAAGYVTAKMPLVFPSSPIASALDGSGAVRSIAGTTPGAGADISETVPTGARWELLSFQATLVTSVAAANRVPQLTLDDGATVYFRLGGALNQAASLTQRRTWFPGAPAPFLDNANSVPYPIPINLRLGAGHRIRTLTTAIDAADQWSAVQYLVREWIEGA